MGKRRKKKKRRLTLIIVLFVLILLMAGALLFLIETNRRNNMTTPYYLAAETKTVEVFNKDKSALSLPRGTSVDIKNKRVKIDEVEYCQFAYNDDIYYILEDYLTQDLRDCVREKNLYVLRDHVLTAAYDDFHISGEVKRSDQVSITDYHELLSDGSVDYYQVNSAGYISSKYLSDEYYDTRLDSSRYSDVYYGEGGDPTAIDYYAKEEFTPRTVMPEAVKALYINAENIWNADEYIALARSTSGINAFVVDIKDCYIDTQLAYDSPIGKQYAPSTENIPNDFASYQNYVRKLKDAGYYLIGRITAFKDDAFASDNEDEALLYNGQLYTYGSVRWPSIFSRKMWEYDVALALEAVNEMGFDEIQFDYVRLPEDVEDVDLRNHQNEGRAEAITEFLRYATEYLHQAGAYISSDVFGEISGDDPDSFSAFVSYYGQFWPAISNCVDAISSMPYPDHFAAYSFGIAEPWAYPGDLMYAWARATYHAQENTYDKAKCRTWIMAQNSDGYDIVYGPDEVAAQINALNNAGVGDGYMTWNAGSSLYKYEQYAPVLN
ncbi:MAG: hypothetical protein IKI61_02955 [Erysipelotrichaceae bacterium]|nr:hypothetical protein [Erysipelotrichaceae bacterium]